MRIVVLWAPDREPPTPLTAATRKPNLSVLTLKAKQIGLNRGDWIHYIIIIMNVTYLLTTVQFARQISCQSSAKQVPMYLPADRFRPVRRLAETEQRVARMETIISFATTINISGVCSNNKSSTSGWLSNYCLKQLFPVFLYSCFSVFLLSSKCTC